MIFAPNNYNIIQSIVIIVTAMEGGTVKMTYSDIFGIIYRPLFVTKNHPNIKPWHLDILL